MDFIENFKKNQENINDILMKFMPESEIVHIDPIIKAMTYSLLAGGKRIRPVFMRETFKACGGTEDAIEVFMASIEMIHTYSLIHDDLPALDNDELRRGMPTCHIQFGENMAILAGDALLNRAFEIIIDESTRSGDLYHLRAMQELAKASGTRGMIGGQVADVLNENKPIDLELLNYIHLHKTSALIEAAFVIGALLAHAQEQEVETFRNIGRNIGLAFQIQDDLLDVTGTTQELGKPMGSDEKNKKVTYVTLMGLEASEEIVEQKLNEAIVLLKSFQNCEFLVEFIEYLRVRKN